jgi:hypothetical protein
MPGSLPDASWGTLRRGCALGCAVSIRRHGEEVTQGRAAGRTSQWRPNAPWPMRCCSLRNFGFPQVRSVYTYMTSWQNGPAHGALDQLPYRGTSRRKRHESERELLTSSDSSHVFRRKPYQPIIIGWCNSHRWPRLTSLH